MAEPPTTTRDPLAGRVLDGRYKLLERIGHGGMGSVYRAEQLSVGQLVAVKILRFDALLDPRKLQRFENEARVIAQLRHPSTLKLIDFGHTEEGMAFLVTELLSGRPLSSYLADGPISIERTLHVVAAVADALAEAHDKGITHRDLKPENIFIEEVGHRSVVKVLDFGIAKGEDASMNTTTGQVFGTSYYMSPEQARGEPVDARSDLYSLGITAYECLSGKRPFVAGSSAAIMLKHLTTSPPPFDELDPPVHIPPSIEALVMGLLEKKKEDRPATALELRREVERLGLTMSADPFGTGEGDAVASSGRTNAGPSNDTRPKRRAAATFPDEASVSQTAPSLVVTSVRGPWPIIAALGVLVIIAAFVYLLTATTGPEVTTAPATGTEVTTPETPAADRTVEPAQIVTDPATSVDAGVAPGATGVASPDAPATPSGATAPPAATAKPAPRRGRKGRAKRAAPPASKSGPPTEVPLEGFVAVFVDGEGE